MKEVVLNTGSIARHLIAVERTLLARSEKLVWVSKEPDERCLERTTVASGPRRGNFFGEEIVALV